MDPWDTVDPLSLPLGASRNDRVIGMTEWGSPVYKTATGQEYYIDPQAAQAGSRVKPMLNALASDPYGSAKGVVNALAQGAWNAISAPGRAAAGQPVTYGDALDTMGMVTLGAMPFAKPQGALGANSFKAYHGSPHDFDRFSMDKIGTGEGAQAYGHGLYFAENEAVAQGYRDALAPGMGDGALRAIGISDSDLRTMRQFTQSSVDPDIALRDWLGWTGKRETPELRAAFMQEWNGRNPGRMYEVQINADPDTFLDWDAPLSEQPNIQALVPGVDGKGKDAINRLYNIASDPIHEAYRRGELPLDEYQKTNPDALVTKSLREAGIPGIKYKDAGSRGAGGSGTRNFVVFDDSLIEILRKYGLVPGMFGAGLYAAQQPSSNEELRNYLGAL